MTGLYVHIPLCKTKCIYCDFYSTAHIGRADLIIDGLVKEFEHRKNEVGNIFDTIYIGGGTPSVIPPDLLYKLVARFSLENCKEFTIEANPDDITADLVKRWREIGINRVSMGVQSLHDPILRTIRRRHSADQAIDAIHMLQDNGIENISCDLIYGLPGLTSEIWVDNLERLLSESISHLSAYCLTYNEGTVLYDMMLSGKVVPATEEEIAGQFETLQNVTSARGFEHYEISNFALPGKRSIHNSNYWNERSTWLGIGPSAHSFDGRTRRIDFADTIQWLNNMPTPYYIDEETDIDRLNDNIVTSLRTSDGLNLNVIDKRIAKCILRDAENFIKSGQMSLKDGYLTINSKYWLISDAFIRELIQI